MTARTRAYNWMFTAFAALPLMVLQTACGQRAAVAAQNTGPVEVFSADKLALWKKPSAAELRKKLSPLQFSVTQEADTESPFNNIYWDNHEAGIYVDIVSGEPLFSSTDKYESGTGWPSFTKPLVAANITTKSDHELGMERTEVRSKHADSHLGHLFDDGPKPTGLRYCMNSASMRFIPVNKLVESGYGEYLKLFNKE